MADPIRDKAFGWPWSTDNLSSHTATLVEAGITLAGLDGVHAVHKTKGWCVCECVRVWVYKSSRVAVFKKKKKVGCIRRHAFWAVIGRAWQGGKASVAERDQGGARRATDPLLQELHAANSKPLVFIRNCINTDHFQELNRIFFIMARLFLHTLISPTTQITSFFFLTVYKTYTLHVLILCTVTSREARLQLEL